MSVQQSNFLKVFGAIAIILITTVIIWTVTILGSIDVMSTNIDYNESNIKATKAYHDRDADKLGARINKVQSNQTIMMQDIKEILKEMK